MKTSNLNAGPIGVERWSSDSVTVRTGALETAVGGLEAVAAAAVAPQGGPPSLQALQQRFVQDGGSAVLFESVLAALEIQADSQGVPAPADVDRLADALKAARTCQSGFSAASQFLVSRPAGLPADERRRVDATFQMKMASAGGFVDLAAAEDLMTAAIQEVRARGR